MLIFISLVGGYVTIWNDRKGRKKEEVLAVYDKAIEIAVERALQRVE